MIASNGPATLRARYHLSQSEFAEVLGISVRTLQQWEQGTRTPSSAALVLLRLVAEQPDIFGLGPRGLPPEKETP